MQQIKQVQVRMKVAKIEASGIVHIRFSERAIGLLSQVSNETIIVNIKDLEVEFQVIGIQESIVKIMIILPKPEGPPPPMEDDDKLEVTVID